MTPDQDSSCTLREPRPGDFGWIVERHGVLYSREFGWGERFEGITAAVVAEYIENFDPEIERCWIAEIEGQKVGSILIMRHAEEPEAARLRLLFVEPAARGKGVGRRLVRECTRFGREAGYKKITLWTTGVLVAARRLYAEEGYTLTETTPFTAFGPELVGETWELSL